VRRESFRALAGLGSDREVTGLVEVIVSPVQPDDRAEAVRTLAAVLRRADPARLQEALAYSNAADLEVRAAFLRVLGPSGQPQALAALRASLKDSDPGVKRAAILALTEWPDATPVPDLLETARTSNDTAHQILAVRGAIQLIGISAPSRPYGESAKMVADTMSLAKQAAEKRALLALMPRYPVKELLDLATSLSSDPEVGQEAKAAAGRLERTVRR
jgi:HEAT repeat protein